jgi:glyoxylase-like metal-dependent hydrolase (beta-lactamase superfamily II)
MGGIKLKLQIFHSGYCVADGAVVNPQEGRGKCRFYATWALLQHPKEGYVLFDTGYSFRFGEATQRWPFRIYGLMTPYFLQKEELAIERLKTIGIDSQEVKMIILSHFHADHIAGLKDFPNAKIVSSRSGLELALRVNGWSAVGAGILPTLLPADLEARTQAIPDEKLASVAELENGHDLFGDGSIRLCALPGHARGQLGAYFHTASGPVLLAADAAWDLAAWKKGILPRSIVRLFFDDWEAYQRTFWALREFQERRPDCRVLFTHSPELVEMDLEPLRNKL